MEKIAKIIFAAALAYAVQARAEGDLLLYFQIVDNPTIINLAGTEVPYGDYTWNGLGVTAARVVSINGEAETPLNLSYNAGGTLTPTGVSVVDMNVHMPLYAAILGDPSSLSFAIELGNYNNGTWTTLATSGSLDYTSLKNSGYTYSAGDLALATLTAWAPPAYSVPEPSSGLLMLLGASLLALKRRRR